MSPRGFPNHLTRFGWAALLAASFLLFAGPLAAQNSSSSASSSVEGSSSGSDKTAAKNATDPGTTKIKVIVTNSLGKPVENASVYVRFPESGGLFHHEKQAELDLKTNLDGSVKIPEVPQGKILIQVVAKGWHTFGKWYDIETAEQTVEIKLEPPPHWY